MDDFSPAIDTYFETAVADAVIFKGKIVFKLFPSGIRIVAGGAAGRDDTCGCND
jgi:hypothetical protein